MIIGLAGNSSFNMHVGIKKIDLMLCSAKIFAAKKWSDNPSSKVINTPINNNYIK